jgi:hypothetical protein
LRAELVVAQTANQLNGMPKPRNRYGLVCALSPGMDVEISSDYGLTYRGNPFGIRNKICINASDNDN